MNEPFGPVYADAYDLLYQEKDYAAECDAIERAAKTYGDGPFHSILDLGCGTGNHALLLSLRGYEVVGVDRSEEMLAKARQKAQDLSTGGHATFLQRDLDGVLLHRHFNIVLMMFAVLGYQQRNSDVLSALKAARRHLLPGGLLFFDVWYGPAVLHQGPSQRIKIIPTSSGEIIRVASGQLNTRHHLCRVRYQIWRLEGEYVTARTQETHLMRYFFPLELEWLLESSGFEAIRLGAFPEFERELDETTWNLFAIARAV